MLANITSVGLSYTFNDGRQIELGVAALTTVATLALAVIVSTTCCCKSFWNSRQVININQTTTAPTPKAEKEPETFGEYVSYYVPKAINVAYNMWFILGIVKGIRGTSTPPPSLFKPL